LSIHLKKSIHVGVLLVQSHFILADWAVHTQ